MFESYRATTDVPTKKDAFVSYTFNGEWQTVWTTLVVRLWYGIEFRRPELWRNAAEFQSANGHLFGLRIDNKQGEGEATISVFFDSKVPDDLKVILIEYVHRHLAKHGQNVRRDRQYSCANCRKRVTDVEAVRSRLRRGKEYVTCQHCDHRVELVDAIERRLKTDPVAKQILRMEERASRELDAQALEQLLNGHVMAVSGEANQIFRPLSVADRSIDGEIEFKDANGHASGKKVLVKLESGAPQLERVSRYGQDVFVVQDVGSLAAWIDNPLDVFLVIRKVESTASKSVIQWMNVSRYLRSANNRREEIVFTGEPLDMQAVWKLRDTFFPRAQ